MQVGASSTTPLINSIFLVTIGDFIASQSKDAENNVIILAKLFNYTAMNPGAEIEINKSDMVLHGDSDVSYLSVSMERSCARGRDTIT